MLLKLERINSDHDSTIGVLSIDGKAVCFTCEDEHRVEKVAAETRIPAGFYPIKLRTVGGFHEKYKVRYAGMHVGMLWLQDVPGFEYVLIHTGNTDDDSAGCILVGLSAMLNASGHGGTVAQSGDAYRLIYPRISTALLQGEDVRLEIVDRDL